MKFCIACVMMCLWGQLCDAQALLSKAQRANLLSYQMDQGLIAAFDKSAYGVFFVPGQGFFYCN